MIYAEHPYAFSLLLILTAAQWVIVPLLCQCAKKIGRNTSIDVGIEVLEKEQARRQQQRSQITPT